MFSRTVSGGGTGPEYAASIILFLSKAKLKDGGDGKEQTGIVVTAKPNKNRFAKPKAIKFHLSFTKGMNPYVGLEEYISWENCGIERGRFISEKDYGKLSDAEQAKCFIHEYVEDEKTNVLYFQPSATARKLCVRHLNGTVGLNQLFTPEVITLDVVQQLEPIIKADFQYGSEITEEDLAEMLED